MLFEVEVHVAGYGKAALKMQFSCNCQVHWSNCRHNSESQSVLFVRCSEHGALMVL